MKEITGKKRRREDNDEITGNEENKAEKEKASRIEKTMNMFKKICIKKSFNNFNIKISKPKQLILGML